MNEKMHSPVVVPLSVSAPAKIVTTFVKCHAIL